MCIPEIARAITSCWISAVPGPFEFDPACPGFEIGSVQLAVAITIEL